MSQLKLSLHDGWTGYWPLLNINALGHKKTPKLPLKTLKNFRKPKNLPISLSLVCRLKSRSPNKPYAISIIIDFGWGFVQPGVHAGHFVPHELLIIVCRSFIFLNLLKLIFLLKLYFQSVRLTLVQHIHIFLFQQMSILNY